MSLYGDRNIIKTQNTKEDFQLVDVIYKLLEYIKKTSTYKYKRKKAKYY